MSGDRLRPDAKQDYVVVTLDTVEEALRIIQELYQKEKTTRVGLLYSEGGRTLTISRLG